MRLRKFQGIFHQGIVGGALPLTLAERFDVSADLFQELRRHDRCCSAPLHLEGRQS